MRRHSTFPRHANIRSSRRSRKAVQLNPAVYDLKPMLAQELYMAEEYKKSLDIYNAIPKDSLDTTSMCAWAVHSEIEGHHRRDCQLRKGKQPGFASVEVAGELAAIFVAQRKFQKAAEQYERKLKVNRKIPARYIMADFRTA